MDRRERRRADEAWAWGVAAFVLLFAMAAAALGLGIYATTRIDENSCAGLCVDGTDGLNGTPGTNGVDGNGTLGSAQFIDETQSPNNSVPPGTAFTLPTTVYNSMPTAVVASSGAGGTVFTLAAGVYYIQYEISLGSAGSLVLYTGATAGSLAVYDASTSGSTTATTWVAGTVLLQVNTTLVVALSSHTGTAAVVTAGNAANIYMVRLTFLKVA